MEITQKIPFSQIIQIKYQRFGISCPEHDGDYVRWVLRNPIDTSPKRIQLVQKLLQCGLLATCCRRRVYLYSAGTDDFRHYG